MTRVGFLGPHGTFAEEALLTQADLAAGEAVPFRDVPHVITAVEQGEVDLGLVPIENSIEGSITVTLDTLAFDTELLVQREVDLPVSLHLCAPKGTKLRRHHHRRVAPQPARPDPHVDGEAPARRGPGGRQLHRRGGPAGGEVAQDGHGVDRHPCRARRTPASRSSPARSRTTPRTRPASCSSATASPRPPATTRRRSCASSARTVPGSLLAILQEFAARAINLTKLESRPTKRDLGDYCFFIDFEGHLDDELVADCLRNLAAKQAKVKFLGSYPVAGRRRPRAPAARSPRRGATRTRGSTACARRSASTQG